MGVRRIGAPEQVWNSLPIRFRCVFAFALFVGLVLTIRYLRMTPNYFPTGLHDPIPYLHAATAMHANGTCEVPAAEPLRNPLDGSELPAIDSNTLCHCSGKRLCSLNAYRTHVQLPALQQFSEPHLPARDPAHVQSRRKWLYFRVIPVSGQNGGHADRLIGIAMAFSLALVLDRAFGLDVHFPVEMEAALTQNLLPWPNRLPEWAVHQQHTSESAQSDLIKVYDFIGVTHPLLELQNDPHPIIVIRANINFMRDFSAGSRWQHEARIPRNWFISRKWSELGFPVESDLNFEFACLFQYLFQPSQPVRKLLARHDLAAVYDPAVTCRFRFSEFVAHAPSNDRPRLVCAQLRFGSGGTGSGENATHSGAGGGVGWPQKDRNFNRLESADLAWNAIDWYLKATVSVGDEAVPYGRPDSYRVFVMTDSALIQKRALERWGADHLISIPGPFAHLDLTPFDAEAEAIARSAFVKVTAENLALGLCDFAVISHSGLGRTGVWRTRIAFDSVQVLTNDQLIPLRDLMFNQ